MWFCLDPGVLASQAFFSLNSVRQIMQTYMICPVLKGESIEACHVPGSRPLEVSGSDSPNTLLSVATVIIPFYQGGD